MIAGAALALLGLAALGRSLSALPHPVKGAALVTGGPYRIARHPIYGGLVLGALGLALWERSWLMLGYGLALAVLLDAKASREERLLSERFGEYRAYQSRTDKLIPWLW